jgi:flagellin
MNGATQAYQIRANTTSMDQLIDTIARVTGGAVKAEVNDNGVLTLSNNTGSTITVSAAGGLDLQAVIGMSAGLGDGLSQRGQIVLTSDDDRPIKISRGGTGTLLDLHNLGFRENQVGGVIEGASISTAAAEAAWGVGDITINGDAISNKNTDRLIAKINAINKATNDTGVTANAFSTVTIDTSGMSIQTAFAGSSDSLVLNGVTISLSTVTTAQQLVDRFNSASNTTGVTAALLGNKIVLETDQGAIRFGAATIDSVFGVTAGGFAGALFEKFMASGAALSVAGSAAAGFVVEAGIKLTSANGNPISFELGVNATAAEIGLLSANASAGGAFGTAIASISIDTAAKSQKALAVIDNALTTINDTRAQLGAINNRLDFTMSNLANVSEKTSASRSRIVDADFAAETAALSRAQVLQQAATAMLAQSNARPEQVLSLLR